MRKGQGNLRKKIIKHISFCEVTGFSKSFALDCSHIKPYCVSTDDEKNDPHNILILLASIHRAFDAGMISFNPENGSIIISKSLSEDDIMRLGLTGREVIRLGGRRPLYLRYHIENIFKGD